MSLLELVAVTDPDRVPRLEACLEAAGAQAITLVSDDPSELDVAPVLEPSPGQTPLWQRVRIAAWLPLDTDLAMLQRELCVIDPGLDQRLDVNFVDSSQVQTEPEPVDELFAERLWLRPRSARLSHSSDIPAVFLDAGLAFGSGTHPTTRMCLRWIATSVHTGMRVLDFGCGSGILGIAAATLGASVVAVDHDQQAVMATQDNAAYNSLAEPDSLQCLHSDDWRPIAFQGEFDLVIANILSAPLIQLADELTKVTKPTGSIVLSGLLASQAQGVRQAYSNIHFAPEQTEEDWVCLAGTRMETGQ